MKKGEMNFANDFPLYKLEGYLCILIAYPVYKNGDVVTTSVELGYTPRQPYENIPRHLVPLVTIFMFVLFPEVENRS